MEIMQDNIQEKWKNHPDKTYIFQCFMKTMEKRKKMLMYFKKKIQSERVRYGHNRSNAIVFDNEINGL